MSETATKHAGGRPSIYTPEIIKKAREYLESCQDYDREVEEEMEEQPHGGALKRVRESSVVKIPTKGGLAKYIGVSRETLYAWAEIYPEFSDIMETLGSEQEDRLINKGLSGEYNPTIAKVLLTKHGYREGVEQTGKDGKPLIPDPLSAEQKAKLDKLLHE